MHNVFLGNVLYRDSIVDLKSKKPEHSSNANTFVYWEGPQKSSHLNKWTSILHSQIQSIEGLLIDTTSVETHTRTTPLYGASCPSGPEHPKLSRSQTSHHAGTSFSQDGRGGVSFDALSPVLLSLSTPTAATCPLSSLCRHHHQQNRSQRNGEWIDITTG